MSQNNGRALKAYSDRNPGLRLVTNVIPGNRNFTHAVARLITMGCVVGFVAGAYQLIGGHAANLWQAKSFAAIVGLSFILSTRYVGFRNTFTGFISAFFGTPQNQTEGLHVFNEGIGKWSMTGAHIFALLNLVQTLTRVSDWNQIISNMAPAFVGYAYAMVFSVILPTYHQKEKNNDMHLADAVIPLMMLGGTYAAYHYLLS